MSKADTPWLAESPVIQTIMAGRRLQVRLDEELARLGLTLRHLGALGDLARKPDMSYSDLARRAGITAPSMLATVRALEELGAVRRTVTRQGHRAQLELTAAGKRLLDKVRVIVGRLDEELTAPLTAAELDALLRAVSPR